MGRPRIGSKGIGFLALARYCDFLEVESSGTVPFRHRFRFPRTPNSVDLMSVLGVPLSRDLFKDRLDLRVYREAADGKRPNRQVHHKLTTGGTRLTIEKDFGPVVVELSIDCKGLGFKATLDFKRLLQLADAADVEKLDDFASITVYEGEKQGRGTCIVARGLRDFVRRELRMDRRKGFVQKNLKSSWSGPIYVASLPLYACFIPECGR